MQTLYLVPYVFSVLKNILFPINSWILLAFACAIIIFSAFRGKKKDKKRLSIPGLNISAISTSYLCLRQIIFGKKAPGIFALEVFQAFTHGFPKEGICYMVRSVKPTVILYRAETVEQLLNSKHFEKGFPYELTMKANDGIFSSDTGKWRERRKLIAPSFSCQILDDFCHTFNEKAIHFTEEIRRLMERNQFIEIDALFSCLTVNIMCDTAIGIKRTNSKKNMNEYMQVTTKLEKLSLDRICMPWLWPDVIFWRSKLGKQAKRLRVFIDKFVNEVILEKKTEKLAQISSSNTQEEKSEFKTSKNKKRSTFLDHLLDIHFQDNKFSISDIAVDVENIVDAGSVTTAVSLSWALYLLGLYPDIQKKVHEELDQVLDEDISSPITKHHVKELKYLDCVIKETLRLYPPVPYISRKLDQETVISGYTVPKGTTCAVFIYGLHRDPEIFPNPEVFDPERFSNEKKRPTHAYIPFSAGPRNCIGQQFAKLENTILLATILRRFKVKSMLPVDKILISSDITLAVRNGLHVAFTPRKKFSSKYLQG